MGTRQQAKQNRCPKCGAEIGEPCLSTRGENRIAVHKERMLEDGNQAILARHLSTTLVPKTDGFVVYGISEHASGKIVYVGQTGCLDKRARGHLRRGLMHVKHPPIRRWLYEAMSSDRVLEFIVLEHCTDEASSLLAETAWVQKLSLEGHPLLNNWRIHKSIIRKNGIKWR